MGWKTLTTIAAALCLLGDATLAQTPSCGSADAPCQVAGGEYFARLPEGADQPPVVIYLHGYGASGRAAIGNTALVKGFTARGYAFVAPTGQPDMVNTKALDWSVHDGQDWRRNDLQFLSQVRDDAVARFGLDPGRVLLVGYSRGGSMVWDVACQAPDFADAFAALSGAFWGPMWDTCQGGSRLFHMHGFSDRTVPFEGRRITFHGVDFEQGSVMKSLAIVTAANGCGQMANAMTTNQARWTKHWTKCAAGELALSLGPHGHGRPEGWMQDVLAWYEALN